MKKKNIDFIDKKRMLASKTILQYFSIESIY